MPDPKLLLSPGFQDDYVMHKLGQAGRRASFTLDQPGGLPMAMKVAGEAYQELIKRLPVRDEVLGHTIFPSCAVVGSSGSLLAYQLGREIDAHGMVLRFNDAPTRNYERHVGSKTTHRLSDGQSIGFHEFKHESLLVLLATLEAVKSFKSVAQANSALRMWPLDPEWTRHVARSMALPATTSMQGLLLALQRCQRVRVFGFQMGQPHDVPHHYYDVCAAPRHPKRYASEAGVLKFLVEAGWVEPGEPCLMQCLHPSGHECARCKLDSNFQSVHLDVSRCSKHASTRAQQQLPQTAASGQPRPKLRSPV